MSNPHVVSASRTIPASAAEIFDVISHTEGHVAMDGSGTLQATLDPQRLELGSEFGMKMRLGIPYRIKNTIVEFEPDKLIAWRHFGRHVWRYELEAQGDETVVTESFDWSNALSRTYIERGGWPKRHVPNMEKTLERLEAEVLRRRTEPGE